MLCNGWTQNNTEKRKIAVKGPIVNKTFSQITAEKCAAARSKRAQRKKAKRKMMKVTNTVFKVSLPLTKGAILLERTSFNMDRLPVSSYSPSADSDVNPSPEAQTEEYEYDCDSGSFAINHSEHTSMCAPSQLQQDFGRGDAGSGQYMGPERNITVPQYQEVDGYFNNGDYFSQSEHISNKQNQGACEERNYNRQSQSQGRSNNFYTEWQNHGQIPAVSHAQEWPSYPSSDRREEGYTEQSYHSSFQNGFDSRVDVPRGERHEISSNATQQYYQQQPTMHHTRLPVGSEGHYGLSGELAPHLVAAEINVNPHRGDSHAHNDSITPETGEQFVKMEQRRLQTYAEVTTGQVPMAPQSYVIQPLAYQPIQVGHRVMSTNADQLFLHPGGGGGSGMSYSNEYIPPGQTPRYEAYSDLNIRVTGFSGGMISGNVTGTPHWNMYAYPVSAYSTPSH
ncbi:uncharacterized protein si:ch211-199g17.2 isoform X1 [Scomber japonicus]|uniref:uncharacterized protein si:ch211-199g17.2 isoform X1 n=1 Tax=Scomber japonicus TaxID=13676 RepID=UPI0023054E04|nr:uncharacterized protein si:ch211-199g17.2 isoform X1 [Scomber japonicus]